jgi:hypothetical protein
LVKAGTAYTSNSLDAVALQVTVDEADLRKQNTP